MVSKFTLQSTVRFGGFERSFPLARNRCHIGDKVRGQLVCIFKVIIIKRPLLVLQNGAPEWLKALAEKFLPLVSLESIEHLNFYENWKSVLKPCGVNPLKNHFTGTGFLLEFFNFTGRIEIDSGAIKTEVSPLNNPLPPKVFRNFCEDGLLLAFERSYLEPLVSFIHQMVLSESGDCLIYNRFPLIQEYVL